MKSLPRFFVLESDGKYLNVTENLAESQQPGLLKFDDVQIWNPRAKFAVERAKTGDGKRVHIRSCYNNKYWQISNVKGDAMRMIVASGKEPEEDRSKESCTLFEVHPVPRNPRSIRLRYVFNLVFACRIMPDHTDDDTIMDGVAISYIPGTLSEFNVTDWETLVILPTQVSFRSEELNGKYLCSRSLDPRWPYQRFESGLDVGDPRVAKELFPTRDGSYRIKDVYFDKFWRRSPNWIWADAEDDNYSNDTLFSIVKISKSVIALRNRGNNNFCGGITMEGKTDCLNAAYPNLSRQVRLVIEERVLNREISDIIYRLSDSRIYQKEVQEVSYAFATNDSPDHPSTITLNYTISDSRTTHWTNSISISLGVKVEFETELIPFIAKGKVELSAGFSFSHEWGVSQTTQSTRGVNYAVVVPPLKSMKVALMCTKGACDVPFSYTQRDLLTNGERVTTTKDDGLYTGINSYNFYFQSSAVSIPTDTVHKSMDTGHKSMDTVHKSMDTGHTSMDTVHKSMDTGLKSDLKELTQPRKLYF